MRKLLSNTILLTLIISKIVSANGFGPMDSVILKADWKEIKTKRYTIHYPYSWKLSQDDPATGFTLYVPGPKSFGAFEKNISLSIQDLSGRGLDLDGYTYLSKRQIHTLVDKSELLESERQDSANYPYHDIIYTGEYDEEQLKWRMRFWVIDEKAYILTYTDTKDTFGLYSKKAEEIMDTFRLNYAKSTTKKPKKKKKEKKPKKSKVPTTDVSIQK